MKRSMSFLPQRSFLSCGGVGRVMGRYAQVNFPLRALADPSMELVDLNFRQRFALWRHVFVGIGAGDAAEELGFACIPGDDRAVAGFKLALSNFRVVQTKSALCLVCSMTFVTAFGEDWPDVAVEVDMGS